MPNHVLHRMTVTGKAEAAEDLFAAGFSKERDEPPERLLEALEAARQAGDEQAAVDLARQVAGMRDGS